MNVLGYDARDLTKKATKTLMAGLLGVLIGSVVQYFLNFGGYPIILTYWIGAFFGFVANFTFQVKAKNIPVKEAEQNEI